MNATLIALGAALRQHVDRPRLEHALLTGRMGRYAFYRMRLMGWRLMLRGAYHVVEITFLGQIFGLEVLEPVFIGKSVAAVTLSAWWGGLEVLREEVRRRAAAGDWVGARVHIRRWLALSGFGAAAGLVAFGTTLALAVNWQIGPSIVDVYLLTIALRLAADVCTRTLHSGIYALRRVYRPAWTLLVPDVLDLTVIVVGWWWLGTWSFPLALLLGTAVKVPLFSFYVWAAYRSTRLRWQPQERWRLRPSRGALGRAAEVLAFGFTNCAAQLDAWLVIGFTGLSRTPESAFVGVFIYVFRPFVAAATGWIHLFYFDLRRLRGVRSPELRLRFRRFLWRLGLWVSGVLSVMAVGVSWALWPQAPKTVSLLFVPFFMARCMWAVRHLEAFVQKRVGVIAVTTAAVASVGLLGIWATTEGAVSLVVVTLALFGGAQAMEFATQPRAEPPSGAVLGLPQWLTCLRDEERGVCVGRLVIDTRLATVPRVIAALHRHLPKATLARLGNELFGYWPAEARYAQDDWVIASAGCLRTLELRGPYPRGDSAMHALRWSTLCPPETSPESAPHGARELDTLRRAFLKDFPAGRWLPLDASRSGVHLSNDEALSIWSAMGKPSAQRSRDKTLHRTLFWDNGAAIKAIAIMPVDGELELRVRWRDRARRYGLSRGRSS